MKMRFPQSAKGIFNTITTYLPTTTSAETKTESVPTNYLRFIVLARSRTGSNFLRGLLNSHSKITIFGEIVADSSQDYVDWDVPGYEQSGRISALRRQDPVLFLERQVFRTFLPDVSAVGFKIFYYHAQDNRWKHVWTYLQSSRALRVIHLKRWNILESLASRKRANLTNQWVETSVQPTQNCAPVSLTYKECLIEFLATVRWETEADLFFENHSMLQVYYKDLITRRDDVLCDIQTFLGVDCEILTPSTRKQSNQSLSQAISNYFELKEQFKGTRWQEFFEE